MIDDPSNLANERVYILAGDADTIVPKVVGAQLAEFCSRFGATNLKSVVNAGLAHTMPTVAFDKACDVSTAPYLAHCGFDAAGELLTWIYGPITRTPTDALRGRFGRFDQTRYVAADRFWWSGMDTVGWLYVPRDCAAGGRCALHIVFHGCKQGQGYVGYGTTFVRHAAYAEWADANRLVVLFPQAVSIPYLNAEGCWDWWGYTTRTTPRNEGYRSRRCARSSMRSPRVRRRTSGGASERSSLRGRRRASS